MGEHDLWMVLNSRGGVSFCHHTESVARAWAKSDGGGLVVLYGPKSAQPPPPPGPVKAPAEMPRRNAVRSLERLRAYDDESPPPLSPAVERLCEAAGRAGEVLDAVSVAALSALGARTAASRSLRRAGGRARGGGEVSGVCGDCRTVDRILNCGNAETTPEAAERVEEAWHDAETRATNLAGELRAARRETWLAWTRAAYYGAIADYNIARRIDRRYAGARTAVLLAEREMHETAGALRAAEATP